MFVSQSALQMVIVALNALQSAIVPFAENIYSLLLHQWQHYPAVIICTECAMTST